MNNLCNLIQRIKENPVSYLDKPSITCLHSFLIGYLSTRFDLGLDREGSRIDGFQEWIQERAKTAVSQSWAGIILFGSGSDRSAFDRFFVEFQMFLNQRDDLKIQENNINEKSQVNKDDLKTHDRELYELMESIKKRPGMYLGHSSITKLDMTLRGRNFALRELGIDLTEQEREFAGFQFWVQEKYRAKSGQSWAKIILFYSVDDHEALIRFFELYEEYLNRDKSSETEMSETSTQVK